MTFVALVTIAFLFWVRLGLKVRFSMIDAVFFVFGVCLVSAVVQEVL